MSSPLMLTSRIYTVNFAMRIMLVIDKSTNKKKKTSVLHLPADCGIAECFI